jgi:hypothetical protein
MFARFGVMRALNRNVRSSVSTYPSVPTMPALMMNAAAPRRRETVLI